MGYDVKIQEESEKISRSVLHKSVEIKDRQYGHYLLRHVKQKVLIER